MVVLNEVLYMYSGALHPTYIYRKRVFYYSYLFYHND